MPDPTLPAYSLRRRLPLLIFAVLGLLGTTFSWMAYHEVKRALRVSGAERIAAAAGKVADLLGQSATARLADAKRLSNDQQVQRAVVTGSLKLAGDLPSAVQTLVSRNPVATVWLYDGSGRLLGALARGKDARADPVADAPSSVSPPGVGPLRSQGGRVWYHTTVPIPAPDGAGDSAGFLSIQRALGSSQAADLIERLIGSGAVLKLGNVSGDIWTDLSAPVPAPPATSRDGTGSYRDPVGEWHVGTSVPVSGTPWLVWVEVPERSVLGAATTLLRRMVPIAIVLTAFGALAVYAVSGRITTPLERVAHAAEAIAAGDYSRRVGVRRADEIGRLGAAFNVMAARVAESHEALELRVQARTQELEYARQELDQFFSLSLDLLCIAGTDGRFRRVNPAWEEVLGWTSADLTACPYIELVHPDDRVATGTEAAKLANGATTVNFENRYRCKDGSYRWLSWTAAPLPQRDLIYAVAHDVTEQKRTERALHQHAADLAVANRELESFSYSVSHDLRTPLRSIDGFAQALVEDYEARLDETGRNFLSRIRTAAQRMGALIDDLLSLSRVTRQELNRTDLDLTGIARDIADRLQETEPARNVEWRLAPDLKARGDARLIRIALENLLSNAWKFTSQRVTATIEFTSVELSGGGRAFAIRDNGAGFDTAHASKLFGAFQRLHDASQFPGTGIGLATVQRILLRHSGRIWAEAAVDRGATFFFTLESR